ncbi:thioredoxin-related protein [Saonia flava]|uniref:Thioredoxin-related protein n=1 Tax=Saonia flava TaxID=523696 RepID=A0A846QYI6_9FLAO|nr:thioredoxin family protein [Saonia flava]NJB69679.1 thioredoxin-related protein [Saonia flava]
MKTKLFILLVLPFISFSQMDSAIEKELNWQTDYNKTMEKARKENKNVVLYFTGSDWCAPCKMLKKDLFDKQEFADLSKEFILLYIDIPRNQDLLSDSQIKHNKDMLPIYNKKGVFPLLKILNPKGKVLDEISGYSMNGEVGYHLNLLKNHK